MSLFRHLVLLPLSYFERRHAGEVASRFISIDRIQQTLTTASTSTVVDGAMTFVLVGMMWLYQPPLAPIRDRDYVPAALMRGLASPPLPSGQRGSGRSPYAAYENSLHFLESLRGMAKHQAAGHW